MTRSRWRALAGVLALSIFSIVVWANDKPRILPACKEECPPCPMACSQQCPWAQCPTKPAEPCCPPTDCPSQNPDHDTSPVPCQCPSPNAVIPIPDGFRPVMEVPTTVKPVVMNTVAAIPYRVRLEMIGAITQIELMRGDEVTLRVQCDRVDVQMPSGGIQAIGKVCVSSPGLDIRCNRMMIGWQAGEIAMEGQVRILCQTGQQRTEMSAESVNCRLNSMGTGLDFNGNDVPKVMRD